MVQRRYYLERVDDRGSILRRVGTIQMDFFNHVRGWWSIPLGEFNSFYNHAHVPNVSINDIRRSYEIYRRFCLEIYYNAVCSLRSGLTSLHDKVSRQRAHNKTHNTQH
jgi:hypothetical protein